jgi:hypothetical protein
VRFSEGFVIVGDLQLKDVAIVVIAHRARMQEKKRVLH